MFKYVIWDEVCYVYYGVFVLKKYFIDLFFEVEWREWEDWVFEVVVLMCNCFMVYEIFEEWFEGIISW